MDADISFKTSVDVARIRRACRAAEKCLRSLAPCVRPGISTAELDNLAGRFLEENGAESALAGIPRISREHLHVREQRRRPRNPVEQGTGERGRL